MVYEAPNVQSNEPTRETDVRTSRACVSSCNETLHRHLLRSGGDASSVPKWASADFDSIYVVRITHHAGTAVASFTVDREGLNGQPAACPAR
jgi:hypothetical protein